MFEISFQNIVTHVLHPHGSSREETSGCMTGVGLTRTGLEGEKRKIMQKL